MQQCAACGGTYQPIQADGTQYFHRCPPLSAVELDAAVQAGKVTLPKNETAADAAARRSYSRNGERDENVPSTLQKDAGKLKAAGMGTTLVADPAPMVTTVKP